ncbi:MAG: sulfatase [Cyclobacteriaceae bacterium]|nr:sulfatase [Cyclobacteriaceae bacterium]
MKRLSIPYSILLFFLVISSCNSRKPNIVFILVDDLGWTDLGVYGSTFYETPNLDKLAGESVMFTNAYSASPVCSPTRAAIMTGKYPTRVNITDWIPGDEPKDRKLLGPKDDHQLALEEITLAETMKKNGYKTFFAGKWHLGDEGFLPEEQGFEINKGGHHRGSPTGTYYSPYQNPKLTDGPEGEYLTDRLTNESVRFMKENKDNPFFLYLAFYTVHTPIQPSKRHLEKFLKKAETLDNQGDPEKLSEHDGCTVSRQVNPEYASMVYAMDENVGKLLAVLDSLGLTENTTVIFTSDNGGLSTLPPYRDAPTSVMPLRAGKGWCYEGGIRVPLLIRQGKGQAGQISDVPVISMDFYPTILEMTHLPAMPDQHKDGLSLVPLLRGKQQLDRESLFWHFPHYHGSTWKPGAAIREGDWKLITFYEEDKTELYNLQTDLGENIEVSDKYPGIVTDLLQKLQQHQSETGAMLPKVNEEFREIL